MWRVAIGTGTGFTPAIDVNVVDSSFALSAQTERCDGAFQHVPDCTISMVTADRSHSRERSGLDVYQLTGRSGPRAPDAGRLIGSRTAWVRTVITYRSAKEDPTTRRRCRSEIVVTAVETEGTQNFGGDVSATRYAYGDAELTFDSVLDAFTLAGYGRVVELQLVSVRGRSVGRATLTDTYRLAPFVPGPETERFGRYLRVGRTRDVTVVSGNLGASAWPLLGLDVTTDPRRIGATHYEWGIRVFEEPAVPGTHPLDCMETSFPYDFAASFGAALGPQGIDMCSVHGFVYGQATDSWRGTAAPPSLAHVATRSEVKEIDDYGRVLQVLHEKDRFRGDDDICGNTVRSAVRRMRACWLRRPRHSGTAGAMTPTYVRIGEYDHLPAGSVSSGFVTAQTMQRRDRRRSLLKDRTFDAICDAAGNVTSVTRTRGGRPVRCRRNSTRSGSRRCAQRCWRAGSRRWKCGSIAIRSPCRR